jgi:general secretion pathway protein C
MTVSNINFNQIWLQLAKYQQQINFILVALLALYLIAYAAELTWRFIPQAEIAALKEVRSPTSTQSNSGSNQRVNLSKLKQLNLFGDLTAEPVEEQTVTEAPETRLNLSLNGLVASSNPAFAAAIIENKGVQNTYGIDEKIEGTNARLLEVFPDRVIIKNGPRRETLMLDGVDFAAVQSSATKPTTQNSPEPVNRTPKRQVLSPEIAEETRELQKSPMGFTDYIAIFPHRPDGSLEGYRISPGKKPKLFKAAGFKAGDIVIEINGLDLTDPQQSLEAMSSLREAQSLQLTVNRSGETLTLYLDFPSAGLEI